MSIEKAITRAYETMRARAWDTIYWAVDLHGVCLNSNYEEGKHEFVSQEAIDTLRYLSSLPETKILLWSSAHDDQKGAIVREFAARGIKVSGFNFNQYEGNTKTGCFDEKFYFSVLLDDKAGFDPSTDWATVRKAVEKARSV